MIDWLTIKLMKYQLKKFKQSKNSVLMGECSYAEIIVNYKRTIFYIDQNRQK